MPTDKLSQKHLENIYEIEQDMWARWIWEFLICNDCNHIHSKDDIVSNLCDQTQKLTVKKILNILNIKTIDCKECGWEMSEIYNQEYIQSIKKRYADFKSYLSTYVVWEQIHGFADSYIANFDEIYSEEFEYYYENIGRKKTQLEVEKLLWISNYSWPYITISSVWLTQEYSNLTVFFKLLSHLFQSIPDKLNNIPWMIEVDNSNCLSSIYMKLWAKKLDLSTLGEVKNKNANHSSSLYILDNPIKTFKQANTQSIKKILKYF